MGAQRANHICQVHRRTKNHFKVSSLSFFNWAASWENLSSWFSTRSDTNRAVQPQKMARGLKFWIQEVEEQYYLCSENKGADQVRRYWAADLRLFFRIWKKQIFSWGGSSLGHTNYCCSHPKIWTYRKVPKFSDTRKICWNLPQIQTKRPNLRVFHQKNANWIAISEDPDQTAPLGAVCSGSALFAQTYLSEHWGSLR